MQIIENYSLLKHNTFHLNIKARWFIEYQSEEELRKLLSDEYFLSQPILHIGQGSNLLFLGDFNGIILHSGLRGVEILSENSTSVRLKAGAAEVWDTWVATCVDQAWGGLENLSLIPGEVGAAAVQNIGAYGVEVSSRIEEVHAYHLPTGKKRIFTNKECQYSYRNSFFKATENRGQYFITHVVYRLSKKPEYTLDYGNVKSQLEGKTIHLQSIREAIIAIRRNKLPDPAVEGNAGSFFMNPCIDARRYEALKKQYPSIPSYPANNETVKIPAAWLIDQCGLKGKTLGGAAVSAQQPLVIVNQNQATGEEIASLAETVRQTVLDTFGIDLQPEVNYI
jgi:UDP-N-acetylmuramate dehydrogenase